MQPDIISKNSILTADIIKRKLRRMALEIAENNQDVPSVIIAGINGNGALLAKKLVSELSAIASISSEIITIQLDKKNPLNATLSPATDVKDKVVIVVDDVSNTGRTLLYALKPLLQSIPKKIQTLVLVERSHKLYAIQPDYVGLTVATTLQEHISVTTEGEEITGAWLH